MRPAKKTSTLSNSLPCLDDPHPHQRNTRINHKEETTKTDNAEKKKDGEPPTPHQ